MTIIDKNSKFKSKFLDFLVNELGMAQVMMSNDSGLYYGLNEVSTEIWKFLKEPHTAEEVIAYLLNKYDVADDECGEQTLIHLQELYALGMIEAIND